MTEYIQIEWTCGNIEEARKIAHLLVKKRLVACANIIPGVESIYRWDDNVETEKEVKVLMKTHEELFEDVKDLIESQASYDVPAIIAFAISDGSDPYLDWIDEVTS